MFYSWVCTIIITSTYGCVKKSCVLFSVRYQTAGVLTMASIELVPTLEHCIESTARKVYNGLVSRCLSGSPVPSDMDETITLLSSFLTTTDFKRLRRESELYLLQGKKVTFTVFNAGDEIKYMMKVT